MKNDDLQFYLLLAEFTLEIADNQSNTHKMILARFETLENFIATASQVIQMPEGYEKNEALYGLHDAISGLSNLKPLGDEIRAGIARSESRREKLEALLKKLESHSGQQ